MCLTTRNQIHAQHSSTIACTRLHVAIWVDVAPHGLLRAQRHIPSEEPRHRLALRFGGGATIAAAAAAAAAATALTATSLTAPAPPAPPAAFVAAAAGGPPPACAAAAPAAAVAAAAAELNAVEVRQVSGFMPPLLRPRRTDNIAADVTPWADDRSGGVAAAAGRRRRGRGLRALRRRGGGASRRLPLHLLESCIQPGPLPCAVLADPAHLQAAVKVALVQPAGRRRCGWEGRVSCGRPSAAQ
jgi:hypothetical protein